MDSSESLGFQVWPEPARTIQDRAFDRRVSLRDAYRIMEHFLASYHERGEAPTAVVLSYLTIDNDGMSGDPAAISDYLESASVVIGPPSGGERPGT